jgi:hypothetical protein
MHFVSVTAFVQESRAVVLLATEEPTMKIEDSIIDRTMLITSGKSCTERNAFET